MCLTLKNPLASDNAPTVPAPDSVILYLLTPFLLEATIVESGSSFPDNTSHRERVRTPEVSLGPAFRSLAPPSLG